MYISSLKSYELTKIRDNKNFEFSNILDMLKRIIIPIIILSYFLVSCESNSKGVAKEYDTRAVAVLDSLSSVIGNLRSCSFSVETEFVDTNGEDDKMLFIEHDIYMRGPDKMYIHSDGDRGEKGYWYNGNKLAFLNFDKSIFDTIRAPNNIILAIDFVHNEYGIDFPAADFFYPTLTDDIIENYNKIYYIGDVKVNDVECVAVSATNEKESLYIWVEKNTYLPYRMVIAQKEELSKVYESTFSNWKVNPHLPDVLFQFTPKSTSKRVKLISKKQK